MKFLVISDLHGSIDAANLAINQFKEQNCNAILCLGDILYHGPRNDIPNDYQPKQVIHLLNQYSKNIIAVRGNCDSEVDQMVLQFPITSDYNQLYLGERRIFMTHGHGYSTTNQPPLEAGSIFLNGHTHIPTAEKNENGIYLLNPGSMTLPKQNHPKTFAILDEMKFTIYTSDLKKYMDIHF